MIQADIEIAAREIARTDELRKTSRLLDNQEEYADGEIWENRRAKSALRRALLGEMDGVITDDAEIWGISPRI